MEHIKEITPQQFFDDGAKQFLHNSKMIMHGKYGGGFYVKFLQDAGSKKGWLMLIIVYPDGQYKSVVLYKNVFKETDLDSNNIGTITRGEVEVAPLLETSIENGDYRMLEKYETPLMPIPAKAIWKQIVDNYSSIPVTTIYQTESVEGMYWELYRVAHEKANSNNFQDSFRENEVRFLVTKEEMETVAIENGYTLSQLRTEFNLLGLLVKDKGSTAESGKRYNSYQLTKKVDGSNCRFYALKKIIKVCEPSIDMETVIEYSAVGEKTMVEHKLEEAEKKISELKQEVKKKRNE